jgi:hypothetical protein
MEIIHGTILPAPHADMAVQVGHDRNDVVRGGPSFFVRGGGGWGMTAIVVVAGVARVLQKIKWKFTRFI